MSENNDNPQRTIDTMAMFADRFTAMGAATKCGDNTENQGPSNAEIMEKLCQLDRKLSLIFGGHALIDGSFVQLQKLSI